MGFTDPNYWKQSPPPQTGDMNNERYLNQKAVLELPGAQAPQELSIADGRISPTRSAIVVDTEGGGAADDLEVINTAVGSGTETLHNGMLITLRAKDPARVVTVKNSAAANGINTADGNDIVLSTAWEITLRLVGGRWYEVPGRASAQAAEAQADAITALGRTIPATTTARGIARVATLADMEPGAIIENGPAVLAAGSDAVTPTPTPNTIMCRDEAGRVRVEDPVHDKDVANKTYVDNSLIWVVTGSITLNGTTDNTVAMTDIVPELALEVGDVIRIDAGAYNKLHTVESITDNSSIIVNYEHAGNRGNGSLKLPDFTGQATITRIAKWFNAPIGMGQAWADVTGGRALSTTYTNTTGRPIQTLVQYQDSGSGGAIFRIGSLTRTTSDLTGGSPYPFWFSAVIPRGETYSIGGGVITPAWWELR